MSNTIILKVFAKVVKTKTYTTTYYHGNALALNPTTNTLEDELVATAKNPTPHIVTLNVRFTNTALQTLQDSGVTFPIAITLKEDDYFITINKDRETKEAKLDKHGNRHAVIVIKSFEKVEKAPLKAMTLEDAYNLE